MKTLFFKMVFVTCLLSTLLIKNSNAQSIIMNPDDPSNTASLKLKELASNGSDYVGFKAPPAIGSANSVVWILPNKDGSSGQFLSTDGAGSLSWKAAANKSLSNLSSPTAINQHLLPDVTNTRDFGSATVSWKDGYFGGSIFLDGTKFIDNSGGNNTWIGNIQNITNTGTANTAVGAGAMKLNVNGSSNCAFGFDALFDNSNGNNNTAQGYYALTYNTSGSNNMAAGYNALYLNTTGSNNVAIGVDALHYNTTATSNTAAGYHAGYTNATGSNNMFLGAYADAISGSLTNASAIGYNAKVKQSNAMILGDTSLIKVSVGTASPGAKFHVAGSESSSHGKNACIEISNRASNGKNWYLRSGASGTSTPAGGFSVADDAAYRMVFDSLGNVGIGTTIPAYRLDVCGTVRAKEVRVEAGWCDYVFDKNYQLMPLTELEQYVNAFRHLPEIPTASTVETEGLSVGETSAAMMKKIEELTLYAIQQDKQLKAVMQQLEDLQKD